MGNDVSICISGWYYCGISKDRFNKPVIIISLDGDIGKASARSIIGFDIGAVIIAATHENILLKGGGHKMAGGFTVKTEKIEIYF